MNTDISQLEVNNIIRINATLTPCLLKFFKTDDFFSFVLLRINNMSKINILQFN